MSRSYTFSYLDLYNCLPDPHFFALAAARPLADRGRRLYAEVLQALSGRGCKGCDVKARLVPLLMEFARGLAKAAPEDREAFALYVARRLGYRPSPLLLHYVGEDRRSQLLRL